jgi:ArsR family transcriptional regulator
MTTGEDPTTPPEAPGGRSGCCPLPAGVSPLPASAGASPADDAALVTVAKALADPNRLRMLRMMLAAQACCRSEASAPPGAKAPPEGVCVCELQSAHGLGQSRVSYHLKVLREAGLVHEHRRGKWSFYAVDGEAARNAVGAVAAVLGV